MTFPHFLIMSIIILQVFVLIGVIVVVVCCRILIEYTHHTRNLLALMRADQYKPISQRGTVKPWDGFQETVNRMRAGAVKGNADE